jgi:chemotaxis protein MotB
MLGGQTISAPGALTSRTAVPSVSLKLEPTSGAQAGDAEEEGGANDKAATAEDSMKAAEMAMKEREGRENAIEEAKFDRAEKEIKETISKTPELKGLEQHLLIDKTPEGMRIQVIDKEGKPMFAGGSAKMLKRTEKLVRAIGNAIATLDNKIRISGHTDSVPFKSKNGYSNWELSSERAQASRRVLASTGLFPDRISSVAGRASLDPLLPDDTKSPRNRRISILLLRRKITEKAEAAKKAAVTKVRRAAKQKKSAPTAPKQDWTGPRIQ